MSGITQHFELIVIGAGPGGMAAALKAAREGKKTLLIERGEVGGTCLNHGCIPTKALLACAELYDQARGGKQFGIPEVTAPFVFSAAAKHRDSVVKRLRAGTQFLIKRAGLAFQAAEALLADERTVRTQEGNFTFDDLIIAAGTVPNPVPFGGACKGGCSEGVVNTDEFLALTEIPERVTIVGGGVTGLELACILVKIGRKVTLIKGTERFLPGFDEELGKFVRRSLEKSGVKFLVPAKVNRVDHIGGSIYVRLVGEGAFNDTADLETDLVVDATRRLPNSESLGCLNLGLEHRHGFLLVDDFGRTSIPHIYAIGDINGRAKLAHAATFQGEHVVENLLRNENRSIFDTAIPACVHTDPEIATVGLSAEEAAAAGISVVASRAEAVANGRLLALGVRNGFVKLIARADDGLLLGAQLAVPRASDLVGEIAVALKSGMTARQLAETIHPHPTVSEMIAEAAKQI